MEAFKISRSSVTVSDSLSDRRKLIREGFTKLISTFDKHAQSDDLCDWFKLIGSLNWPMGGHITELVNHIICDFSLVGCV